LPPAKLERSSDPDVRFQAPEVRAGGPKGFATDVYSVGCLLFWLLTGQEPPLTAEQQERASQALAPLEPDDARPLARLIRQAWAEPADRPSAREVEERLCAIGAMLHGARHASPTVLIPPSQDRLLTPDAGAPSRTSQPFTRSQLGRFRLVAK